MVKSTKPELKTNKWYEQVNGTRVMLVLEYPWYHLRRWQGYRFRDNTGLYRTKEGRVDSSRSRLLDIDVTLVKSTPG